MDLYENSFQAVRGGAVGCLLEDRSFYRLTMSPYATLFESDNVTGDLLFRPGAGADNVVWRGFQSSATGSKITFTGHGNTVFLGAHSRLSNADIRITGNNCLFYFGAFSTVESMIVMLTGPHGKIVIGDFCMLSARIIIDRSDHHSIYEVATGMRLNFDQDVCIKNHVWVGRDVRINKGTTVNSDVIIGQASVVAGTLGEQTLFAGVPARPLRTGVTWSRMKSESMEEMESSSRHQAFLRKIDDLRLRIGSDSEA